MKYILLSLASAASLVTVSADAAQERTDVSITVRTDDLNLDNAGDLRVLDARIKRAAYDACGLRGKRLPLARFDRQCLRTALDQARVQVAEVTYSRLTRRLAGAR